MAIKIGSGVVKDGLILHLDASDTLNYLLSVVEVLVVAGGGGGGVCYGGGGGAGGLIYNNNYSVTPGSAITVTIGGGGTNQVNVSGNGGPGANSVFGNIISTGGGFGGGSCGNAGGSGGSGGGGSGTGSARVNGGSGIAGQGNNGETSIVPGGGGGGGAGSNGYQRSGGDGLAFNISGQVQYYSGGGTGGGTGDLPGGAGGGGMGGTAVAADRANGRTNTGGGGGGSIISGTGISGIGGSGIVIVRYPGPQKATGGNAITQVGGYTIHTFTTSGTFTPSAAPANSGAVYGLQDLSGNNNTGTQSGGVTYNSDNGGALSFDGGDASHIQIVNTAGQLDFPGDFTVSLWIYPTQYHRTYQTMIDTYPGGATNGWIFTTMYISSQVISWYTEGSSWQASGTAVTLNAWNHVVASRIGTTVKLYKNATEIHSHSDSSNIRGGVGKIGKGLNEGNDYGNIFGRISNVQIYKGKGLTAAEILQNYNATKGRFGL